MWFADALKLVPIAVVVAALGLLIHWFYRAVDKEEARLDTLLGRRHIRHELSSRDSRRNYQKSIKRLRARLQNWMGRPLSFQALDRCLAVALFYPIFSFLLGWLVSGNGTLSGLPLVESTDAFGVRLAQFCLLASSTLLVAYIYSKQDAAADGINRQLTRLAWLEKILNASAKRNLAEAISYFAVAVAVALALAFVVAVAVAGVGVVVVVVAGVVVVVVVGVVVGVVAVAVAVGNTVTAIFLAVFLLLLPLVNALADAASWTATRYFLKRASTSKRTGWRMAGELILDLIADLAVAILCLFVLTALMANVMELVIVTLPQFNDIIPRWEDQLFLAINDPWGSGLFVWLMLATTLAPTALHLAVGLSGLWVASLPGSKQWANKVPIGRKGQSFADLGTEGQDARLKNRVARHLVLRRFSILPSALATSFAVALFGYAALQFAGSVGIGLGHVAFCSTAWSHGYCSLFGLEDPNTPIPRELTSTVLATLRGEPVLSAN